MLLTLALTRTLLAPIEPNPNPNPNRDPGGAALGEWLGSWSAFKGPANPNPTPNPNGAVVGKSCSTRYLSPLPPLSTTPGAVVGKWCSRNLRRNPRIYGQKTLCGSLAVLQRVPKRDWP